MAFALLPSSRTARVGAALRSTTWLLCLMLALEASFAIGLVLSGSNITPFVNIGLAGATQWIPVAIFWLVAYRTAFARWDVIFAALGVTFSAMGDTYYSLAMDGAGLLAFPSPADIGYLLFYPLMIVALIALVRGQTRREAMSSVVLDSTVAALGAAALLAALLGPVFESAISGDDVLASMVAVAYPVLDLVLVAVIVGVAASPSLDIGPRWIWLVLGLLIFTAADTVYALLEYQGSYIAGTPLDALWALGLACLAWWVDGFERVDLHALHPRSHRLRLPVPALAVATGLGVLIAGTQLSLSPLALAFAAGAVGLASVPVMLRQRFLSNLLAAQEILLRQTEQLDRSKTELMTTINHELRTPITSIRGYLELVADGEGGEIPDRAATMLRVVGHNAERLEGLIDDMMLMSSLEERVVQSDLSGVALRPLLERVVAAMYPQAMRRDVELSLEAGSLSPMVEGDVAQLERVFTNIVDNAVKFTPAHGSVRLTLDEALSINDEPIVVVRTIDTGMGIPAKEIPLLFTRFFRASNAHGEAVRGTGLGLAIVKNLVAAHGGEVVISSPAGEGTTVLVALPTTEA